MERKEATDPPAWFERKENVQRIVLGLFVICGGWLLLDIVFWLTEFDKHPYLRWEQFPGFYGVIGFVACVLIAVVGRFVLRPLVQKEEDYYEQNSTEEEADA